MTSTVVSSRHKLVFLCLIPVLGSMSLAGPSRAAAAVKLSDIFAPYMKMNSFKGTVQITAAFTSAKSPGTNIFGSINLAYKSPNKLFAEVEGLTGGGQIVSNGSTSYAYSAMTNSYSASPAPKKPLQMLTALFGGTYSIKLSGKKTVNGHKCNIYSGTLESEMGSGQVTIDQDSSSKLIQDVEILMPNFEMPRGGRYTFLINENYTNQEVNPSIPASKFQFQPPAGAQKAPSSTIPSLLGPLSTTMP